MSRTRFRELPRERFANGFVCGGLWCVGQGVGSGVGKGAGLVVGEGVRIPAD